MKYPFIEQKLFNIKNLPPAVSIKKWATMKQEGEGDFPCHIHLYTLLEPMQSCFKYSKLTN